MIDLVNLILSAIVSGAVSWLVASAVSGRTERGKQAFAARGRVKEVVHPVLLSVQDYAAGQNNSLQRSGAEHYQEDFIFGVKVRVAADDLSRFRLFLVRRRLKKLLGTAYASGLEHGSNREFSLEEAQNRFARYSGVEQIARDPAEQPRGLMPRALQSPPFSKEVTKLLRELHRLERSL